MIIKDYIIILISQEPPWADIRPILSSLVIDRKETICSHLGILWALLTHHISAHAEASPGLTSHLALITTIRFDQKRILILGVLKCKGIVIWGGYWGGRGSPEWSLDAVHIVGLLLLGLVLGLGRFKVKLVGGILKWTELVRGLLVVIWLRLHRHVLVLRSVLILVRKGGCERGLQLESTLVLVALLELVVVLLLLVWVVESHRLEFEFHLLLLLIWRIVWLLKVIGVLLRLELIIKLICWLLCWCIHGLSYERIRRGLSGLIQKWIVLSLRCALLFEKRIDWVRWFLLRFFDFLSCLLIIVCLLRCFKILFFFGLIKSDRFELKLKFGRSRLKLIWALFLWLWHHFSWRAAVWLSRFGLNLLDFFLIFTFLVRALLFLCLFFVFNLLWWLLEQLIPSFHQIIFLWLFFVFLFLFFFHDLCLGFLFRLLFLRVLLYDGLCKVNLFVDCFFNLDFLVLRVSLELLLQLA